jgi:hypothetical protein
LLLLLLLLCAFACLLNLAWSWCLFVSLLLTCSACFACFSQIAQWERNLLLFLVSDFGLELMFCLWLYVS